MKISYQALSGDRNLLLEDEHVEQPERKFTRVSPFLIFVFAVLGVAAVKMTMQQTNIETPLAEVPVGGPQCVVKEGDDTGIAPGTDTGDAIPSPITVGAHEYELKPNWCLRKPHETWAAQIMKGKRVGKETYDFMVKAWDGTQAGNVAGLIAKSAWLNEIPPNDKFGFERMGETSTASVTNPKFVGEAHTATVFVTTKADGETFQDVLPTPCDRKPYTENVLAAINALGEKGIFHLDLQAHNWMVNKETKKVFIIDWKTAIKFTSETEFELGAPAKGDPTYAETLTKLKLHYGDWANKFGMGVTKENINTMFTKTKFQEWSLKFAQNGMLWRSLKDEKYEGPKNGAPPIPTEDPTITECPST